MVLSAYACACVQAGAAMNFSSTMSLFKPGTIHVGQIRVKTAATAEQGDGEQQDP
jgi:hypothetical protein